MDFAVAEEHACIEVKNGRLYCTALVGDPDYFLDDTFTWLNDSELRPGKACLPTHLLPLCAQNLLRYWLMYTSQVWHSMSAS